VVARGGGMKGRRGTSGRTWLYAVTFENPDSGPPQTVRGTIQAGNAAYAASISVREAKKAMPRKRWESMVILLEPKQAGAAAPGGGA